MEHARTTGCNWCARTDRSDRRNWPARNAGSNRATRSHWNPRTPGSDRLARNTRRARTTGTPRYTGSDRSSRTARNSGASGTDGSPRTSRLNHSCCHECGIPPLVSANLLDRYESVRSRFRWCLLVGRQLWRRHCQQNEHTQRLDRRHVHRRL